jgi:hypothetical protein
MPVEASKCKNYSKIAGKTMRPDAQYLVEISHPSKEFDAIKFVEECISHEIEQLRHASVSSSLNGYVTQNGYPIPKELLANSSYVIRRMFLTG